MRLLGFEHEGAEWMGAVDDGFIEPLAPIDEFYLEVDRWLERPARRSGRNIALSGVKQVPAVPRTAKVLCLGHNYRSHAEETHRELPPHPAVFARYASTLVASGDSVPVPVGEKGLDWEVELAVVVGRSLYGATETEAAAAVLGYTALNDISARVHQFHTTQWTMGKNADRSAPIGPVIVTKGDIDATSLSLETRVNGSVMQQGNTRDMIYSVHFTLAYLSQIMTLEPGDVLSTGTPGGIGFRRTPPILLGDGDVVEVEIEQIGQLRTPIVASRR